ncbi:hypothetical protein GIS00_23045 [Nakamurella sp. YIM 132087]|uniref:Alpha-amylase n=1 Tax=Nakamurella alba TaxID=2665158 RepID=A0A7K1FVF4_9ACTN|nr:carboxypeptidase-like regulatory domain-containing protein [Nakamurella alba]MTD16814.1 hypothetical protein [Nakamurella alba]
MRRTLTALLIPVLAAGTLTAATSASAAPARTPATVTSGVVPPAPATTSSAPTTSAAPAVPAAGGFVPVTAARVADTRVGIGTPRTRIPAGGAITVQMSTRGGLPTIGNISAVLVSITALTPAATGSIVAYPSGTGRPGVSHLSFTAGSGATTTSAVARIGADGKITFANNSPATTDLAVDVAGYWRSGAATAAGAFTPVPAIRTLDTRTGLGAPKTAVPANGSIELQVSGRGGVPTISRVGAIALTITAVGPTAAGNLQVRPDGGARTGDPDISYIPGRNTANLVIVKPGANGKIRLFNTSGGTVHLVADVAGYYLAGTATAPGTSTTLIPSRVLDSRAGKGITAGPVTAGESVALQVSANGGVPPLTSVGAVVLEVSVVGASRSGTVQVFPDMSSEPATTAVSVAAGTTTSTRVVVAPGPNGKVRFTNSTGANVQLVAAVTGWSRIVPAAPGITGKVTAPSGGGIGGLLVTVTPYDPGSTSIIIEPSTSAERAATTPDDPRRYAAGPDGQLRTIAPGSRPAATADMIEGIRRVRTAADGTYRVTGLSTGAYEVCFSDTRSVTYGYASACWNGKSGTSLWNRADQVRVNADRVSSGIDASLVPTGRITGTVTTPAGVPAGGIVVMPSRMDFMSFYNTVTTESDGSFVIEGLAPGSYGLCAGNPFFSGETLPTGTGVAEQCLDGVNPALQPAAPEVVPVRSGTTTSGVDFVLGAGGQISGRVVTYSSGAALGGINVTVQTVDGVARGYTTTASDGRYHVPNLPAADYVVCFAQYEPPAAGTGYLPSCEINEEIEVTVAAGASVTAPQYRMATASGITGTVRGSDGRPLANVEVVATELVSGDVMPQPRVHYGITGSNGVYKINRITNRSVRVCFYPEGPTGPTFGSAGECYRDAPVGSGSALQVYIPAEGYAKNIDATLGVGGAATGRITDAAGRGVPDVTVLAMTGRGTGTVVGSASTDASGGYRMGGLPAGSFVFCSYPIDTEVNATPATGFTFSCRPAPSSTTPVVIRNGQVTAGVDIAMGTGGAIAGRITDSSGRPVEGAWVTIAEADAPMPEYGMVPTGSDGRYLLTGLQAGIWKVCVLADPFDQRAPSQSYADRCYTQAATPSAGTGVGVRTGTITRNIDVELPPLT